MSKRQVFFNSDVRGITLLSVAVHSLLKTNDPSKPISLYIVHDREFASAGGCDQIREIVSRFPFATVWFGDLTPLLDRYEAVLSTPLTKNVTKLIWAFPLCDKILPETVTGKIVYIDIDMLICHDLGELFDMDLAREGMVAAAVNESRRADRPYLVAAGWPEEAGYSFNNACSVLDLDVFRAEHLSDRMLDWYARHKDVAINTDQDCQNMIYGARTKRIPIRWNYTDGWLERVPRLNPFAKEWRVFPPIDVLEAIFDPAIIHYIGRRKPTRWTHRSERKRFRRELEELGLLHGDYPDETLIRKFVAHCFDVYHFLIRCYARMLLKLLRARSAKTR